MTAKTQKYSEAWEKQKITTHEHAVAMGKKGGAVKSQAKRYAAQIRMMKKQGKTDEQLSWFLARLEDPECDIVHIRRLLDKFISDNPDEKSKLAAINTMISLHKANHGEKRLNRNLNVNISIDVERESAELDEYIKSVQ